MHPQIIILPDKPNEKNTKRIILRAGSLLRHPDCHGKPLADDKKKL